MPGSKSDPKDPSELEKAYSLLSCESDTLSRDFQEICHISETETSSKIDLEKLQETRDSLRAEVSNLEQQLKDREVSLAEKQEEVTDKQAEHKSYKFEEQLFRKVTKIVFDLDAPPGTVGGYTTKGGLKTFQFDTTKHGQFEITNQIWSLLDSPAEEKEDESQGKKE